MVYLLNYLLLLYSLNNPLFLLLVMILVAHLLKEIQMPCKALFFKWDMEGNNTIISAQESRFHVFGDVREIKEINLKNGKQLLLVTQNQNRLLTFEKK